MEKMLEIRPQTIDYFHKTYRSGKIRIGKRNDNILWYTEEFIPFLFSFWVKHKMLIPANTAFLKDYPMWPQNPLDDAFVEESLVGQSPRVLAIINGLNDRFHICSPQVLLNQFILQIFLCQNRIQKRLGWHA
jgi:hypothetical protein